MAEATYRMDFKVSVSASAEASLKVRARRANILMERLRATVCCLDRVVTFRKVFSGLEDDQLSKAIVACAGCLLLWSGVEGLEKDLAQAGELVFWPQRDYLEYTGCNL